MRKVFPWDEVYDEAVIIMQFIIMLNGGHRHSNYTTLRVAAGVWIPPAAQRGDTSTKDLGSAPSLRRRCIRISNNIILRILIT
jgi:hypothetical protein